MADKNLESITFDSIPNKYLIPALKVDDTLSVAGEAADAKKTGDEITDLKADLNEYGLANSFNGQLFDGYWNGQGQRIQWTNDVCNAEKIACPPNANIIITISSPITDFSYFISYYDNTGNRIKRDTGTGLYYTGIASLNTTHICFTLEKEGLTVSDISRVKVSINDKILTIEQDINTVKNEFSLITNIINLFNKNDIYLADKKMFTDESTVQDNPDYDTYFIDLGAVRASVYMYGATEILNFRAYTSDRVGISGFQNGLSRLAPTLITLPENTRFIRVSISKSNQPYFMVTLDATYELYPHYNLNTYVNNSVINWWAGKIGDSLGDSLTEARFFQLYTKRYFGLSKFYIHGIGGTKLSGNANQYGDSMWMDSRINAINTDADFVTVLGGQNDGDVTIGEISKTNLNTDTYIGALNTIINKLYAHCKQGVCIILCTPFYVPAEGANSERFYRLDEAVRAVAKLHGLPVADFGGLSTADENTADLYWETDRTHPIESFYAEKLAPILIDTLEKIRPIDWIRINNYGKLMNSINYLP